MAKQPKWRDDTGPAENARKHLPQLAGAYFAMGRKLLAKDPTPADLHKLRLESKRFRYAIELFKPCYAAGLEERLEALKTVQDMLGDCNDAVASGPLVEKLLKGRPEDQAHLRVFLEKLAEEKAAAFRKHWETEFDATGKEQWWTGYLARNARPPVKGR